MESSLPRPKHTKTVRVLGMPCFSQQTSRSQKPVTCVNVSRWGVCVESEGMRCSWAMLSARGYYVTPVPG